MYLFKKIYIYYKCIKMILIILVQIDFKYKECLYLMIFMWVTYIQIVGIHHYTL